MEISSHQPPVGNERPPAPIPAEPDLRALRAAAPACRACDLWEGSTQPVLGVGAAAARLMSGSRTTMDSELASHVTLTAHPSSILRARGTSERNEAMGQFIDDLQEVAGWLHAKS